MAIIEKDVEIYAAEGLRTLVFGFKEVEKTMIASV